MGYKMIESGSDNTSQASLVKRVHRAAVTNITAANPCVVTAPGHDYANLEVVYVEGMVGMDELNGHYFVVLGTDIAAGTFQLSGVNSTGYVAYVSGGDATRLTPPPASGIVTLIYDDSYDIASIVDAIQLLKEKLAVEGP